MIAADWVEVEKLENEITRLKALLTQCKEFIDTLDFAEDDTEQQELLAAIEKELG